ncbi:hypothetical protein MFIFM68171_10470 [Madurella fahalii]|uniref:Zn(2)-C6 fungal-type domain-containing protein n=1 Tax=Madurella fahalii TaxID=1157608 RepID=A0ABQ0GRB8_9PEZI
MVYCGKASQGCQSCRARRIKCDKVRPQCTQCIRVGKSCPGYRDQLSLMFRDESTKVIQKAHAQWGVTEASELGEPSSSSPPATSPSAIRGRSSVSGAATSRSQYITRAGPKSPLGGPPGRSLPRELSPTTVDKAIQFYLDHYVIGLPDEPKAGQELQTQRWVHADATRDIMAAVGLAGLSNITGDKQMNTLARQHYGSALQNISSSIRDVARLDLEIVLRSVVMMAMFEIVRGRDEPVSTARTHIMGGAAILSSYLPLYESPAEGLRGLLQLCFSMAASIQGSLLYTSPEPNVIIPTQAGSHTGEGTIPATFFDWVSMSAKMVSATDKPSAELIGIIIRLVQLSALVRSHPLVDGCQKTADVIRDALELERELDAWEQRQEGIWSAREEHIGGDFFPPEAVFQGCYHVYTDMYVARVWTHLRWSRIMVNQMLIESVEMFPVSSLPLISRPQQQLAQDHITRLARDTLVSVPSHYRHPYIQPVHCDYLDKTKGGAGMGAAGIPTLLFELKVASCAPGIPHHYRTWALRTIETVWRTTGMYQAKVLADIVRKMVEYGSPRQQSPASASDRS